MRPPLRSTTRQHQSEGLSIDFEDAQHGLVRCLGLRKAIRARPPRRRRLREVIPPPHCDGAHPLHIPVPLGSVLERVGGHLLRPSPARPRRPSPSNLCRRVASWQPVRSHVCVACSGTVPRRWVPGQPRTPRRSLPGILRLLKSRAQGTCCRAGVLRHRSALDEEMVDVLISHRCRLPIRAGSRFE